MRQHIAIALARPRAEPARGWPPCPGLALAACALLAAGCEEDAARRRTDPVQGRGRRGRRPGRPGSTAEQADPGPAAQPKPKTPTNSGPIIGQRTQDIKDANAELKTGKAQVASTRIVAKDPITLQGNAYVSIIGQTSIAQHPARHGPVPRRRTTAIPRITTSSWTRSSRRTTSPCPSCRPTRSTATTRTSTSSSSWSTPTARISRSGTPGSSRSLRGAGRTRCSRG